MHDTYLFAVIAPILYVSFCNQEGAAHKVNLHRAVTPAGFDLVYCMYIQEGGSQNRKKGQVCRAA